MTRVAAFSAGTEAEQMVVKDVGVDMKDWLTEATRAGTPMLLEPTSVSAAIVIV
jgi:hypothetical protein